MRAVMASFADNSPSVFNVHVLPFMERIWNALRDNRMGVREVAVGALRSCLKLVEKRETRYRVQWWYRLFDQTIVGLEKPLNFKPHETEVYVHASLLALGELLEHSGEFMLARCDCMTRFPALQSAKNQRRAVVFGANPATE
jgi:serine/threonine-protein kinase mTOR